MQRLGYDEKVMTLLGMMKYYSAVFITRIKKKLPNVLEIIF